MADTLASVLAAHGERPQVEAWAWGGPGEPGLVERVMERALNDPAPLFQDAVTTALRGELGVLDGVR